MLELFRLPGETATAWFSAFAPDIVERLGIADGAGRATAVMTVSILAWLAVVLLVGFIVEKIRDIDRKLTSYVSGRYAESLRQIRILRRRLASAIGALRERRSAASEASGIAVTELALPQIHSRILRCLGGAGDGRGMAAIDVAARLKLTSHQVEGVMRRLLQEHLVERSFGTDEGLETHRITRAGQIYLLEH